MRLTPDALSLEGVEALSFPRFSTLPNTSAPYQTAFNPTPTSFSPAGQYTQHARRCQRTTRAVVWQTR